MFNSRLNAHGRTRFNKGTKKPIPLFSQKNYCCHKKDAHTRKNVISNTFFDIPENSPHKKKRHIIAMEEILNTRDIYRGKNFTIK